MSADSTKHEKRLAIMLYPDVQRRIADLAKTYTLNQSDVVEVMLDVLEAQPENIEALMQKKRESKVAGRSSKTAILKSLSKLSAEQLEELTKMLPAKA